MTKLEPDRLRTNVVRVRWVEYNCIACGRVAGRTEGGMRLVPHSAGSARMRGDQVVCGHCGGNLQPTEQGVNTTFE